jgi:hypothetical protein
MIIELGEKLVDRCLQLLKARRDRRRSLLADHVEPIMTTFEQLHGIYVTTFREAHEAISNAPDPISKTNSIGENLLRESLFTSDKRILLLSSSINLRDYDELSALVESINSYLNTSSYWIFEDVSKLDRIEEMLKRMDHEIMDNDVNESAYFLRTLRLTMQNVRATVGTHFKMKVFGIRAGDKESFRAERLHELEEVMKRIQGKYAGVQLAYHAARLELLK